MTRKILLPILTIVVAVVMQSCGLGIANALQKSIDESNEILEGKVFQTKCGKVTYNDGVIFTFDEYGKKQRIEDETSIIIYQNDESQITIDKTSSEKIAYKQNYSGYGFSTAYCFLEESIRAGESVDQYTDENIKESTETIAGKKCVVFTLGEDKVGGWKRILFLNNELRATSFSTNVSSADFEIPDGYSIVDIESYSY